MGIDGGGGDGDDPGDACIGSLLDHFVDSAGVVGESEVGVGVDHGQW